MQLQKPIIVKRWVELLNKRILQSKDVGCSRAEKNKERDVLHQAICKVPHIWEGGLPKKRMGKMHDVLWMPEEER